MIAQLPAYLAAVLGSALAYEMAILIGFVFVVNLRRMALRSVRPKD